MTTLDGLVLPCKLAIPKAVRHVTKLRVRGSDPGFVGSSGGTGFQDQTLRQMDNSISLRVRVDVPMQPPPVSGGKQLSWSVP